MIVRNRNLQMKRGIDQGPIILMIENYRTGLLWKLFMKIPDIQNGLKN